MGLGIGENAAQLRPIVHFLKGQHLHGRAGDDHPVKSPAAHLVEGLVKGGQVGAGHVGALVGAHVQQAQFHLQRAVGQHPGDLCFSGDLGGHQVHQQKMCIRDSALYSEDAAKTLRKSHENPVLKKIYDEYLGQPGGEMCIRDSVKPNHAKM